MFYIFFYIMSMLRIKIYSLVNKTVMIISYIRKI